MHTEGEYFREAMADPGVRVAAQRGTITTTLYDLIAAIASVESDDRVVTTMVHVLRSGRLSFPPAAGLPHCRPVADETWLSKEGHDGSIP